LETDDLVIGGVGRLEPIKGFTHLVDAAHTVCPALPKARFLLAGDGSQVDALRAQAEGLGQRFRLLGMRDDIPEVMAALDIFVLPSLNEGMGRVLLQAAAAGVPAVASAVGGVPDIIEDGRTGVLVPPGDVGVMADRIIVLAEDAARRQSLGQAAQQAAVPAYSVENMVRKIEALYESVLMEKGLDH